jgi:L-alanine-DL-glutamate epimerase-like enolase superfamily enzyme
MKITGLEAWRVDTKLKEPYTIAYETIDAVTNIFLRIDTGDGIRGYGCAAPDAHVTGETPEDVLNACRDRVTPVLEGASPLRREKLLLDLNRLEHDFPSTAAMVDMALWDILGKKAGLPVFRLLGGCREHMPTSITIGIMSVEETVKKAREWVKQGFRVLKIKGGRHVTEDIERMIKVREALGEEVELRFDANQGYTVARALQFAEGVAGARVEMMEQPTPKEHKEWLGEVRKQSPVPVMADESLMNLEDAYYMARQQLVDMLNIKLMKVGGISPALEIDALARAAGQTVMIGCMDESALAIAAGLHFALARPNVKYADLDGHLDLVDDPAAGAVKLENGILYPLDKPGLGFEP